MVTPELAGVPGTPASLTRRWGSLIYEMLVVAAVMLVAGFAALPFLDTPATASRGASALQLLPPASRAFLSFYYVAILGLYCVYFWTRGRRTLAMKTWRLTLETHDGRSLDARTAVRRYLTAWIGPAIGLAAYAWLGRVGLLLGFVNYAWAWLDRDRLFLHDRLAASRITRSS